MKRLTLLLIVSTLPAGCSSRTLTNTPRSAIEQMLLSGAVDRAMEKLDLPEVDGKDVFIDFNNLKSYDVEYVRVAVRARICQQGATLVEEADDADLIAEVSSGALGVEFKEGLIGIPPLPVPNAPVPIPAAPFYRTTEQTGIVKLLIFLHDRGRFVAANHYYARADRDESFLLWWRFQHADDVREGWERADLKLGRDRQAEEPDRPAPAAKRIGVKD